MPAATTPTAVPGLVADLFHAVPRVGLRTHHGFVSLLPNLQTTIEPLQPQLCSLLGARWTDRCQSSACPSPVRTTDCWRLLYRSVAQQDIALFLCGRPRGSVRIDAHGRSPTCSSLTRRSRRKPFLLRTPHINTHPSADVTLTACKCKCKYKVRSPAKAILMRHCGCSEMQAKPAVGGSFLQVSLAPALKLL